MYSKVNKNAYNGARFAGIEGGCDVVVHVDVVAGGGGNGGDGHAPSRTRHRHLGAGGYELRHFSSFRL